MTAALLGLMVAVAVLIAAGIAMTKRLQASLRSLRGEGAEWNKHAIQGDARDSGPPE